ncbi:long-chain-fatty-acid--CoA ligase [Cupriavidus oxalaticus]|uniref:long-chain-fatty-acid--CoA ligase n=1 Tax=Cupriavidus oxalaticus TaxID=96344 RepID=UPI003172DDFC
MDPTEFEACRRNRALQALPCTMMDRPLRVTDVMRRAEQLFPTREIVTRTAPGVISRRTYADVALEARRLATVLAERGVQPGQRVATLMWNHDRHLAAYYAVPALDAVLHPINPRLSAQEIAYIIADAGDVALLIDEDLLPLWREVHGLVAVPLVIVHGDGMAARTAGLPRWQDLVRDDVVPRAWPSTPVDETAPVSVCYTSGTTGRPKGVVYSHRSILLHGLAASLPDAFGISGRDTLMPLTPMFHVNGWSMPYTAVLLGAKLVLTGARPSSRDILDLLDSERVTATFGVPTVWTDVLAAVDAAPTRWRLQPGLRIYAGGSAPPPEMFRRFDALGVWLQTGWGMTECSPIGTQTWLRPEYDGADAAQRLQIRCSNGLPLPFIEIRHVGDAGDALPWDGKALGELQVRGPWVTSAYVGIAGPLPAVSDDGWLKTGDIVRISPDGYLWLVDRLKDLVKSGGEWISSIDMENALCEHPDVLEAAVIAVPDPHWSERPLALVAPRAGASLTGQQLREHLLNQFPKWMVPEHIEIVPALPRTSVGKINKLALRQRYTGT